ncbi:MAG: hypothetical protein RL071_480 [Pseudomonadota bacterium]|jgi:hypothetical protein
MTQKFSILSARNGAVGVVAVLGLGLAGCDPEAAEKAAECTDVCSKVEECGATPPSPGGLFGDAGSTGNAAADCAANCVQEDSNKYGYADCQIDCLLNVECGQMNDCWDATSDVFDQYCGGNTTPVAPDDSAAGEIENGTNTGSSEADEAVDNPAVEGSVDGSGFVVNYGDNPPQIAGLFDVAGSIDDSSNARAPGAQILTQLCFHNQQAGSSGTTTDYCESGVPGIVSAPITGEGNNFTMYFTYPGQATILFSGSTDDAGAISGDVEALVVYLYSTDVWEHSFTGWANAGDCDAGFCTQ